MIHGGSDREAIAIWPACVLGLPMRVGEKLSALLVHARTALRAVTTTAVVETPSA